MAQTLPLGVGPWHNQEWGKTRPARHIAPAHDPAHGTPDSAMADHDDGQLADVLDEDMAAALATLSVRDIKARLRAAGVAPSVMAACVEKGELVALLVQAGTGDGDGDGGGGGGGGGGNNALLKSMFGSAGALSAEHEMKVMAMSVSELKELLRALDVDYKGVTEKAELQELAVRGKRDVREVAGQDDVAEHLLEC